ncbi:MAG TPA: hypothetical protein QGH10_25685 [Armatimonadota bacterium]|nr:hypothetical protein [Armatimonadota bacterium]
MAEERKQPGACCWVEDRVREIQATPWAAHFRNARKETLLGIRALIDGCIERIDEVGQPTGPEKIEVE